MGSTSFHGDFSGGRGVGGVGLGDPDFERLRNAENRGGIDEGEPPDFIGRKKAVGGKRGNDGGGDESFGENGASLLERLDEEFGLSGGETERGGEAVFDGDDDDAKLGVEVGVFGHRETETVTGLAEIESGGGALQVGDALRREAAETVGVFIVLLGSAFRVDLAGR
jgi:hypothetical protein